MHTAWSLSLLTLLSCVFVIADLPPLISSDAAIYNAGDLGGVPLGDIVSTNGRYNRFLRSTWASKACLKPPGYHYVLAPHGVLVEHAGPMLIDANDGHQVWFLEGYGTTYNLDVQRYRGEDYLTWWTGDNALRDHGKGYYYIMDNRYQMYKTLHAVGAGLDGDLHEFTITQDDTAVITIYHTMPFDLSEFGITSSDDNDTYISESMFQEIDIETNELLFEWRAIDHVPLDANVHGSGDRGSTLDTAWDWFHINSVEKHPDGNYLISSRYTHALYCIDGRSGDVIWSLGGASNNFTDLSDGRATSIARQHHARWVEDYTAITVFDNGDDIDPDIWRSRGMKITVNTTDMTAEILAEAYHPSNYTTYSQGSTQQLENGNLLVGWGNTGAFTEFSPDGSKILCDWQYEALFSGEDGTWDAGKVESYRVFLRQWKGYPLTVPVVAFVEHENTFYVTWNGATEVRHWRLEGKADVFTRTDSWELVSQFAHAGFESNITLGDEPYDIFRLTAVDAYMEILGCWSVQLDGTVLDFDLHQSSSARMTRLWHVDLGWHSFLLFAIVVMFLVCMITSRIRGRPVQKMYGWDLFPKWQQELVTKYAGELDSDDD